MNKNRIKKEEKNDFDDLKALLLKNLSPQSIQNDGEGEIIHNDDNDNLLNLSVDEYPQSHDSSAQIADSNRDNNRNKSKKISNERKLETKYTKVQEEVNDFEDLKGLLLKSLSEQKPQIGEIDDIDKNDYKVDDPFQSDANEGLQLIHDKTEIDKSVQSINNNLNKLLDSRKQRKKKHTIPSNQWALVAVGIVLILAILAYFVIHLNGMK